MLTQERLKELFVYNQDTGELIVAKNRKGSSKKIGMIAGSITKAGYIEIDIDAKRYTVHRLAFLYMNGKFPDNVVDHINGIKDDNRFSNLVECSQADNRQNVTKLKSTNTTGFTGVFVHKDKYRAKINIDGKQVHLGEFDTKELASEAYQKAKSSLHTHFRKIQMKDK